MGENTITKPLGLVFIITAHMVFNDPSHAQVIGIFGSNITLQFTFNVSINVNSQIGIYITGEKKIDDFKSWKGSFVICPQNNSVFYHIINLTLNHTNTYWASLFGGNLRKSNEVKLTVEERNISCTAPPPSTKPTVFNESSNSLSINKIIIIFAVLPVVLLATVLPWLICSLVRPKEAGSGGDAKPSLALNKQQQQQERPQSSTPTVQESVASLSSVSAPSVIYSVLDFPKRPPTIVEINPRDTEYAAVSYLTEKRHM
ncbi:uncharacterized protein LOC102209246 isoform X1 [Pundamilia nyererei]|uniref:Uncharacterized protein LOC102209246 isoform X1 n=1 Tax=Pundamilia nyererei TaxID=303518 RepID=A0A9Y3R2U3_9CICH|nr:PREDICTED: uncharacterized protein LOC102209246 isoform X1 [Pundamilia nyererei]